MVLEFKIHSNEDVQMAGGVYVIIWNAGYVVSVNNVPRARIFNQRQVTAFKAHEGAAGEIVADEPAVEEEMVPGVAHFGI